MKLERITIVALAAIAVFTVAGCDKPKKETESPKTDTVRSPRARQTQGNAFADLRKQALAATPGMLNLSLPDDKTIVYGIVMDWDMGNVVASTVSYATGDASMYLSSGGGVIGGGQHEDISKASKKFTAMAQNLIGMAARTSETPLPGPNEIRFYFLTTDGLYVGKERMENFRNNSSPWLGLFAQGNNVLAELRKTSGG